MQIELGFFSLLFLIFLILKLTHIITWSWWFVTMPLYLVPLAVLVCAPVVIFIVWMLGR